MNNSSGAIDQIRQMRRNSPGHVERDDSQDDDPDAFSDRHASDRMSGVRACCGGKNRLTQHPKYRPDREKREDSSPNCSPMRPERIRCRLSSVSKICHFLPPYCADIFQMPCHGKGLSRGRECGVVASATQFASRKPLLLAALSELRLRLRVPPIVLGTTMRSGAAISALTAPEFGALH